MVAANKKVLKEYSKDDEQGQRIIKSQQEYLEKARAYTNISERAYLNTMAELEE
jgi:TRAP-type mannitol/chloroaromatic compound transport system substrate-binding protein